MIGRIVIWSGLATIAIAIMLAGAIHVNATDWDGGYPVYHCGTLLAPNMFPNSTRQDLGNAMVVTDNCQMARNLRAEWATALGVLGVATIGVGVALGSRRRVTDYEPERELV